MEGRRGEGEMRKMKRIVGIMIFLLMMGCNSGSVEEESNNKDKF